MKAKPILFSTPMVQAILEGRKTETRRIIKSHKYASGGLEINHYPPTVIEWDSNGNKLETKPKYKEGDILWVRESFQDAAILGDLLKGDREFIYKADIDSWIDYERIKWKPSIFMPKKACRIFLEVTNVKIQRLHDITERDSINEGVERMTDISAPNGIGYKFYPSGDIRDSIYVYNPRVSFYSLWRMINGQESWDKNPLVWVYQFMITGNQ